MNGIIIGIGTFLIIGLLHPVVIKAEYHLGTKCWWVFLLSGIVCIAVSLIVDLIIVSALLAVLGFSLLWSMSGGDIKAVQGENGQKDPKMVTHQYSRILDEDRIRLADAMNDDFYRKDECKTEENEMLKAVKDNPELFKQFMAFMSVTNSANNRG